MTCGDVFLERVLLMAHPHEQRKAMTARVAGSRQAKPLDAGSFQPMISSFRRHLAAEAKAAGTVRTYTDAVRWFAAAHLILCTSYRSWEQVRGQDIQRWTVWLLGRYSDA
jgi:hypothetical protein